MPGQMRVVLVQIIEQGLQQRQGIHGPSIYTGNAGVAYMYLRVAESLQQSQLGFAAGHPDQPTDKTSHQAFVKKAHSLLSPEDVGPMSQRRTQVRCNKAGSGQHSRQYCAHLMHQRARLADIHRFEIFGNMMF